jgi:D-tagatose-1,6-bisphosphate aldolase subunit GatZ/KbaZ
MTAGQRWLQEMVARQHAGMATGIYAVCSANEYVLRASVLRALADGSPLLVEATCNQVNQFGGYTGQTPAQFARSLEELVGDYGLPRDRLILGGDHLGPNPWRREPAALAMNKARTLVRDCVLAGYEKIHLDASMSLGGDPPGQPLAPDEIAERVAMLAAAAESAAGEAGREGPLYVIGTEVPAPGGAGAAEETLSISDPADVEATIALTRRAFAGRGLEAAWERVIAVVVQPGVEFGDSGWHAYQPEAARPLSQLIEQKQGLVFEAHSTDYQTQAALQQLVAGHFAILKVGPALTFAFREAIFSLAMIEEAWLDGTVIPSAVPLALEEAMLSHPEHWEGYYIGDSVAQRFARRYSYSDRSRYYWPEPMVTAAVAQLLRNLSARPLPLPLLSQFAPQQYAKVRTGELPNTPFAVIYDRIGGVLADYACACGFATASSC